jgi:hypothetical protein
MRVFMSSDSNAGLVILSPSGSGKTKFCELAFAEYTSVFDVLRPMYSDIDNHKALVDVVTNFLDTATYTTTRHKRKVVFFDDIDILFSQDRYANTFVQNLIGACKAKIVMTCTTGEERKATEVKKKSSVIRLDLPSSTDLKSIMMGDAVAIAYSKDLGNNVRSIQLAMQGSHSAVEKDLRAYFDQNIYQIVETIFDRYAESNVNDLEVALSSDPSLISYMMYDNYKGYIDAHTPDKALPHPLDFYHMPLIANVFVTTSLLEDYAFANNDWNLVEVANISRTLCIRNMQKQLAETQQPLPLPFNIQYTQITSRSAQHYNIAKKMASLTEIAPNNIPFFTSIKSAYIAKGAPSKTNLGAVCNAFAFNILKKSTSKSRK